MYHTRDYRHCEAQFCSGKMRIEELEQENAALKEHVADHQLLFKDYATAQHSIKRLREVLGYYTNATSGTDGEDDGGIARRALALPDSTAKLDAVMKDAQSWRNLENKMKEKP